MSDLFALALAESQRLMGLCMGDPDLLARLEQAAEQVADCLRKGGKVMACGNGGSLCDAAHFAEELTGRFRQDRPPLAAIAFTDAAHITCVGNDFGFEEVFSRPVEALGRPGDILLLLSTSGNSPNLVRAAEAGRRRGVHILGFLGRGGGQLVALCDHSIVVPGEASDRIQELHMLFLHALIESVENRLGYTGA